MAEASETTRPTADEVFASFLRDISQPGAVVGVDFGSSTQEIAAHIVECCNGYRKALAALREARGMLSSCGFDGIYDDPDPDLVASWNKSLAKIDAVLSDLGERN